MLIAMHLWPLLFIQYAIPLRKKVVVPLGKEKEEVSLSTQSVPFREVKRPCLYMVQLSSTLLSKPNDTFS